MEQGTREKWSAQVRRWRESGLSAEEFAHRHAINVHTLRWWRWRLAGESAKSERSQRSTDMAPLTFVEMTGVMPSDPMELVLTTGVRVRLPPTFEAEALERLLDVLARRT